MSEILKVMGILLLAALVIPCLIVAAGLVVLVPLLLAGRLPGMDDLLFCLNLSLMVVLLVPPAMMTRVLLREKAAPPPEALP